MGRSRGGATVFLGYQAPKSDEVNGKRTSNLSKPWKGVTKAAKKPDRHLDTKRGTGGGSYQESDITWCSRAVFKEGVTARILALERWEQVYRLQIEDLEV